MFTAKLKFCTFDEKDSVSVVVDGLGTLEQAVAYGHRRAAELSVEKHVPMFLSYVFVNGQNFVCLPSPGFYAVNVRELSRNDA